MTLARFFAVPALSAGILGGALGLANAAGAAVTTSTSPEAGHAAVATTQRATPHLRQTPTVTATTGTTTGSGEADSGRSAVPSGGAGV